MSYASVVAYMETYGRAGDILRMPTSTATVQLAAETLGVEPARIAKTLSFYHGDHALLIVAAGDARIDNRKFKDHFGIRPKMLAAGDVEPLTGHAPGGVCPFAVPDGAEVWLDESLRRFVSVYPACGSSDSAICLTIAELEEYSRTQGWVDVAKTSPAE